MAKYPVPGLVKTRLAASLGAQRACELYRAFLRDIDSRMRNPPWSVVWAISPAGSRFDGILGSGPRRYIDQRGATLGERMHRAFLDVFESAATRVVMIGADAPQLTAADIQRSFEALADNDVTVIPSRDGGYCSIGLRSPLDLFTAIQMSTSSVLDETRALCLQRGLSVAELPPRYDIDEIEDVRRLERELDRASLPATATVIEQWRRLGVL